ncbi:MAG: molybdopterin-guanine dinucleotide biosynthesis protein B [Chloroflexi bacterium]|nr:molybdopterin-guanine dinucleotide biosynthesis protein B [Chloroflexota bacterium]
MKTPIVSIIGKSDSGKTTLLEGLIGELKRRGYRVGTIKHDAHSFEVDHPGTDTWRHAQAGSDHVVISSPQRVASIRRVEQEQRLDELATRMTDVDIILTEGYRRGNAPKIEVSRRERSSTLMCRSDELLAVASDQLFDLNVPQYGLNDYAGLADLIKAHFLITNVE